MCDINSFHSAIKTNVISLTWLQSQGYYNPSPLPDLFFVLETQTPFTLTLILSLNTKIDSNKMSFPKCSPSSWLFILPVFNASLSFFERFHGLPELPFLVIDHYCQVATAFSTGLSYLSKRETWPFPSRL